MKTFTTFTELFEAVEKANGQMNLEIILNRRTNFGNGWEDFTMEESEFRNQINLIVDEVLGGWKSHKGRIKYILNNTPLQHWGFSRIIFNGKRWQYVAGQDYTIELTQIRNFIKK